MKILSKFYDYYDSCLAAGVDTTVIFKREQETSDYRDILDEYYQYRTAREQFFSKDKKPHVVSRYATRLKHNKKLILRTGVVGFCGEFYPYAYANIMDYFDHDYESGEYFYSYDELVEFIRGYFPDYVKRVKGIDLLDIPNEIHRWHADELHEHFIGKYTKLESIFRDRGIAYFDISPNQSYHYGVGFVKYPELKKLNFARVVDPFTAFQKIEQFITVVLGVGEPETVEIGDTYKRDAKGFDEWSFKNQPPMPGKSRKIRKQKRKLKGRNNG